MKPKKYILSSDYATIGNDSDTVTITVAIPATSISAGVTQTYNNTATVGTVGAPIEYDINYPLSSRRWKTPQLFFVENTSTINQYQGYINVFRSSTNVVKVFVTVFYGGPSASVVKTARTVTVRVRTFLPLI
jgi:hypothetical protein